METGQRTALIFAAIIVALGFVAYANSLVGEFIWDDEFLIQDNTRVKSWSNLPKIFTENAGAGAGRKWNFYRPLQILTYMADYSLWKLKPGGYHLSSLCFHILAALSLWWLVNLLFADRLLSFLTAVLFTVHPVHTEAVSYISGRSDLLASLFLLLGFIFYLKGIVSTGTGFFTVAAISYVLALFSRENSLIFPVLLLMYHLSFKRKVVLRQFLPFPAAAFIYVLFRMTALRNLFSAAAPETTLFQRIPGFFAALTGYVRLWLLPLFLHVEYGNRLFSFTDPAVIGGVILLAGLICVTALARRRSPVVAFSLGWFLVALLPVSNLYPINAYLAEHWLYLPSIGLFLLLAKGLGLLYARKNMRVAGAVLTVGLIGFYSGFTIRQNTYWREPLIFYERTMKYAPASPRMHNNLALIYDSLERYDAAVNSFRKAIELQPDFAVAYYNLSRTYRKMGRYEDSLSSAQKAIEISPDFAEAYMSLGLTRKALGEYPEAIVNSRKAIEIRPDLAAGYYCLGEAYLAAGKPESAVAAYKKALKLNPGSADAYNGLGNAYFQIGEEDAATDAYKKVIAIEPNYGAAYNNLAVVYHKNGRYELAIKHCERALELGYQVDPGFLRLIEQVRDKPLQPAGKKG